MGVETFFGLNPGQMIRMKVGDDRVRKIKRLLLGVEHHISTRLHGVFSIYMFGNLIFKDKLIAEFTGIFYV